MSQAPKDTRTPAEKARDTAGIIGSLMHEGYVPNPEDEAIHQMAERGEITTEQLIAIFRERAVERERKALARERPQPFEARSNANVSDRYDDIPTGSQTERYRPQTVG